MPKRKSIQKPVALPTLPELDQSKKAVLDALVSKHSQRASSLEPAQTLIAFKFLIYTMHETEKIIVKYPSGIN